MPEAVAEVADADADRPEDDPLELATWTRWASSAWANEFRASLAVNPPVVIEWRLPAFAVTTRVS